MSQQQTPTLLSSSIPPFFGYDTIEEEYMFHSRLCIGIIYLISPITFLFLRYIFPANWGKTFSTLLGPVVPPRLGWCLFEIPNLFWVIVCYYYYYYYNNNNSDEDIQTQTTTNTGSSLPLPNAILLALFAGHYINRAIIYPLTLNPYSKPLPLEICLSAHLYTHMNGYLQSRALCQFVIFPDGYERSPTFLFGLLLFVMGVLINWHSDHILRNLRKPNHNHNQHTITTTTTTTTSTSCSEYVIPYGGLFTYVSNPHYLGEIIEWTGFAVACWNSPAAWSFVTFTAANLIPRAIAHHQWYLHNFGDKYPRQRTAVIPFLC